MKSSNSYRKTLNKLDYLVGPIGSQLSKGLKTICLLNKRLPQTFILENLRVTVVS